VVVFKSRPVGEHVPSPLKVGVLRDSFLSGAPRERGPTNDAGMETIAPFFSETRFIHWNTLAEDAPAVEKTFAGSDVIVVQVTQGNLGNVIAHERKLVDLAKTLSRKEGFAEGRAITGPGRSAASIGRSCAKRRRQRSHRQPTCRAPHT
jgi:hypothetical protein